MRVGIATCKMALAGSAGGKAPVTFLHVGKTYPMTEDSEGVILIEIEAIETIIPMSLEMFKEHFEEICWEYVSADAEGAQNVGK